MSAFSDKAKEKHQKMSSYLKELRKSKGLTMRQLSQQLGTPHSLVGKVENQDRRLDIAEFMLYCEAMNKDPIEVYAELMAL